MKCKPFVNHSFKVLGSLVAITSVLTGCASGTTEANFHCGKAPSGWCEPMRDVETRVTMENQTALPSPFDRDEGVSWTREPVNE